MCFSSPKAPPPPPKPPQAPQYADRTVQEAGRRTRRQSIASTGLSSTNKTGALGLTDEANVGKRKLGG